MLLKVQPIYVPIY